MVKLTILDGPDIGRVFTVPAGPIVIGRGDDCEVILHDAMVSRHHCRIDEEESIFTVSDLRTPNGIFLNRGRSRIDTRTLIDGDEISLGHSRLRIELPRPGEEQPALLKMDPATVACHRRPSSPKRAGRVSMVWETSVSLRSTNP